MNHTGTPTLTPAHTAAPVRYVVPKINGNADAVFALATAYRDLGEAVTTSHQRVAHVVGDLSSAWRGVGHRGIDAPVETFLRNATALAAALEQAAAELETYGHKLALAHHHHGFSLRKILTVTAIVAVSATAIIVTMGAAGVVEAAVATAAVDSATEAAGAAVVADTSAATGLDAVFEQLPYLRPLLGFVVPHLVDVEWSSGAMAVYDELTTGKLNWRAIAETGATAFLASSGAAKATKLFDAPEWSPHVIQGTAWATAAAGDDELIDHRVDPLDVAESFVLAGGGNVARDAMKAHGLWFPEPDYRRQALIALLGKNGRITNADIAHELSLLRQPVRELQRGRIDLRLHEGPGHTIDRHISKSADELLTRVRTSRTRVASTYWDEAGARDAIQRTLRANNATVSRWIAAGSPNTLRLRLSVPYDIGFAINRRGTVSFVRQAMVVLRRDHAGIVLVTSYPLGHK
jgi:uncharacterized protein YukE